MITYVLPTRDRPAQLAATLAALGRLPSHGAQVIIVDNCSALPPKAPITLANGLPVEVVFRSRNEGAAARNAGVAAADRTCSWIVMLDDDSCPTDTHFLRALHEAPADVAAIAAEITLPTQNRRESGGLPEVFIGCGVAIRRDAFIESGGYDPSFDYYAEEYDLSARLLMSGSRIVLDRRFRVEHHKVTAGRSMDRILRRLVRNNGWVMQRYAPDSVRRRELRETISRYWRIALKERAARGYAHGLAELMATLHRQRRTPMSEAIFARFTGLARARASLQAAYAETPFSTALVVDEGKNAWCIHHALHELGVREVGDAADAEALIIGTMSPGPMLDAYERRTGTALAAAVAPALQRVIAPWSTLVEPAAMSRTLRDVA